MPVVGHPLRLKGAGAALPVCGRRLRAGSVRPQHLRAGTAGLVDHPPVYQARLVPPTCPTADLRTSRPHGRSALWGTPDPAHPATAAHQPPAISADHRGRRRGPAHHRRLQPARPPPRQDHDDQAHRRGYAVVCPPRWRKSPSPAAPCIDGAPTCWPTSTTTPPTGRPKRSTAV